MSTDNDVNIAKPKPLACAVCFQTFGVRSNKLVDVGESIENLIQDLLWKEYDTSLAVCPKKICGTCKVNIYKLSRGSSKLCTTWMEKISQVHLYCPF